METDKEQRMIAIKFDVSQNIWETSEADPDDEWSRASTGGSVSILGAKIVAKDVYDCLSVDADLKAGDPIWLVWAQYETGDSFGRDGGQYELLEVCLSEEEAHHRRAHYEGVTDYSVPWNGYFESLDGIYVQAMTLEAEREPLSVQQQH